MDVTAEPQTAEHADALQVTAADGPVTRALIGGARRANAALEEAVHGVERSRESLDGYQEAAAKSRNDLDELVHEIRLRRAAPPRDLHTREG